MSRNSIIKRHKIINPEILDTYYIQNRSIIGISGHYGNWEWGSMSGGLQVKHNAIAFYKRLSNKYIERLLKKSREKCGTQLASIKDTYETFQVNKERVCAYLMIADKSPSFDQLKKAYWLDFMGIDTAFLYGSEKYAKMYNLPVVYIDIKPIRRGYYELELFPITDNPNSLEDGELTKMFVRMLEKRINDNPQYWIWSHRRWKRSREKQG